MVVTTWSEAQRHSHPSDLECELHTCHEVLLVQRHWCISPLLDDVLMERRLAAPHPRVFPVSEVRQYPPAAPRCVPGCALDTKAATQHPRSSPWSEGPTLDLEEDLVHEPLRHALLRERLDHFALLDRQHRNTHDLRLLPCHTAPDGKKHNVA